MKKISALILVLGLVFGTAFLSPTVSAKTTYKTLAFDKKLANESDFSSGELRNVKIKKNVDGIEMEAENENGGEYITPVIEAPFKANFVGLHWKENQIDANLLDVSVRFSRDGQNFGQWQKANVELEENRDDKPQSEIFAALIGVEDSDFAQARIEFTSVDGISPKLKNFTFTFINSGEASKQVDKKLSLAPRGTAQESVGTLKTSPQGLGVNIISREDWGADESYRFDRKGKEEWPRSWHGTRKIVVHHTAVASSNGVTDFEANKAAVRAIYYYHAVTQDWGDIGYNALVDGAGNVYEGRYGTHEGATRTEPTADQILPLDIEAGHTSGYNSGSFGVSAMGDFNDFEIQAAQQTGLENAMAYVADSRGINTQGNTDFRRYDGTWHMDLNNAIAHRDATGTECPGNLLYAKMTEIYSNVDNRLDLATSNLDGFSATMNGNPISGTSVGLGTLNFSWLSFPGAASYQYVLERVYGTTGSSTDFEPWQAAWLIPENSAVKTTNEASVQIDSGTLVANGNYVFYVRALDVAGFPISTVSHVNFVKNATLPVDTVAPTAQILKPSDGATVTGITVVSVAATDNVKVVLLELYIDGKKVASSSSEALNFNWNTKKAATGTHTILAKAYDAANNTDTDLITVTK